MEPNSAGNGKRLQPRQRSANTKEFAPKSHAASSVVSSVPAPRQMKMQIWAPVQDITAAITEALVYNELTPYDHKRPVETAQIVPWAFMVEQNVIKYVAFEGGHKQRLEKFGKAGLRRVLCNPSWSPKYAPFTIRRIGSDPRAWADQTIAAHVAFCKIMMNMAFPPDAGQLEAEVLVRANEYLHKAFSKQLGYGCLIDVANATTPKMLWRINQLYGITPERYNKAEVPCAPEDGKPCMRVKCEKCNTEAMCQNRRRFASRGFMYPWYVCPKCPDSVKAVWPQPVAGAS